MCERSGSNIGLLTNLMLGYRTIRNLNRFRAEKLSNFCHYSQAISKQLFVKIVLLNIKAKEMVLFQQIVSYLGLIKAKVFDPMKKLRID